MSKEIVSKILNIKPKNLDWNFSAENAFNIKLLLLNNLSKSLKFLNNATEIVDYQNKDICINITENYISTIIYFYLLNSSYLSFSVCNENKEFNPDTHRSPLSLYTEPLNIVISEYDSKKDAIGFLKTPILLKQLTGKNTGLVLYGEYAGLVGVINFEKKFFYAPRLINESIFNGASFSYQPTLRGYDKDNLKVLSTDTKETFMRIMTRVLLGQVNEESLCFNQKNKITDKIKSQRDYFSSSKMISDIQKLRINLLPILISLLNIVHNENKEIIPKPVNLNEFNAVKNPQI